MAQTVPGKDAKAPRDVGVLGAIAGRLLWVALPVALCAAIYLIYNFYASQLGTFPVGPDGRRLTAEAQAHITQAIHVTSLILTIAGSLAALFALLRHYDSDAAIFGMAAAGAVAYLGVPMLINHQLVTIGRPHNAVTSELVWAFQAFGKVALVLAAARVIGGLFLKLVRRPRRVQVETAKRVKGAASQPGMWSPCWELSKCRDYLREVCPNSRDQVTCWRRKSGCGCDPQLARRLANAKERYQGAVDAIEERAQAAAPEPAERQALLKHRRAMCRECAIYLEHQEYKYRALQWMMYPLAVVLIWAFWRWIDAAYKWGMNGLDRLMASLTLLPKTEADTIANQILGIDVEWLVMLCLAVLLVTFLLRTLERWVFDWKW